MSTKRSSKSKLIRKPEAILLDIDGTTTDPNFISKTLFPIIESSFGKFLDNTYDLPETKELIRNLRKISNSGDYPGMPSIVVGSKEQVIKSVVDNIKWQMNNDKSTSELKFFELLCWLWAYENNRIKGHVYDDVAPSFHSWKSKGIKIFIFSSGMKLAQKLLFANTIHGNIYSLIDDFFDTTIGSKKETDSYKIISKSIGIQVDRVLFITDSPAEARCAIKANLQSVVIERPENRVTNEFPDILRINSLKDIKF